MPLRIALPCLVFGRAGRCDQGGIHDHSLPHRHASLTQANLDRFKDRLTQVVLFQKVAEAEDLGLIGDPVTDQINPCNPPHGGHFNQGLFDRWITQRVPLLEQIDTQHSGEWIIRSPSLLAGWGGVGFDQRYQGLL